MTKERNEVVPGEQFVETFVSDKRVYTVSLRKKESEDDFLLVVSEKIKEKEGDPENNFPANKLRIYNESLETFFNLLDKVRKIIQERKNEEEKVGS